MDKKSKIHSYKELSEKIYCVEERSNEINLITQPCLNRKWLWCLRKNNTSWKIISGTWNFENSGRITSFVKPKVKFGESIACIGGSKRLNEVSLHVKFKILSKTAFYSLIKLQILYQL